MENRKRIHDLPFSCFAHITNYLGKKADVMNLLLVSKHINRRLHDVGGRHLLCVNVPFKLDYWGYGSCRGSSGCDIPMLKQLSAFVASISFPFVQCAIVDLNIGPNDIETLFVRFPFLRRVKVVSVSEHYFGYPERWDNKRFSDICSEIEKHKTERANEFLKYITACCTTIEQFSWIPLDTASEKPSSHVVFTNPRAFERFLNLKKLELTLWNPSIGSDGETACLFGSLDKDVIFGKSIGNLQQLAELHLVRAHNSRWINTLLSVLQIPKNLKLLSSRRHPGEIMARSYEDVASTQVPQFYENRDDLVKSLTVHKHYAQCLFRLCSCKRGCRLEELEFRSVYKSSTCMAVCPRCSKSSSKYLMEIDMFGRVTISVHMAGAIYIDISNNKPLLFKVKNFGTATVLDLKNIIVEDSVDGGIHSVHRILAILFKHPVVSYNFSASDDALLVHYIHALSAAKDPWPKCIIRRRRS